MIFVEAMQRAQAPTRPRSEEIEQPGYIGTGGIVNMSPADHIGLDLRPSICLEIKGGDWTLVPGT